VSAFLGQGDGTFATKVDFSTGAIEAGWAQAYGVVAVDLNHDGWPDLAVSNSAGSVGRLNATVLLQACHF
jgi:hypothetical protein